MEPIEKLLERLTLAGGKCEPRDEGKLTIKVPKSAESIGREVADRKVEVLEFLSRPVNQPANTEPEPVQATEQAIVASKSALARLPEPGKRYWWFSSTSYPEKKIQFGMPYEEHGGIELPVEADYWCYEGEKQWTRVDRSIRLKPEVEKRPKRVQKS